MWCQGHTEGRKGPEESPAKPEVSALNYKSRAVPRQVVFLEAHLFLGLMLGCVWSRSDPPGVATTGAMLPERMLS